MFLLDNFKGQPQLVEVQQTEGDLSASRASILRGGLNPAANPKQTVELDGEHATVYAHVAVPSIYIKMEDDVSDQGPPPGETDSAKPSLPSLDAPRKPEQSQQPEQGAVDRFRIVHLKVNKGKRIVGDLKHVAGSKTNQEQNSVKTTIDHVGSSWLKLTPTEDLPPGEYAIVETKGNNSMNLYIWPFGVNPNAPANSNPWTPEAKSPAAPK